MRKMIIENGSGPEIRSGFLEDTGCGAGKGIRILLNTSTMFSADACQPEDVDIVDDGFGSPTEDPGEVLKRTLNGGKYL